MDTLMVKESSFWLTPERMESLTKLATRLLTEYNYPVTEDALHKIFESWAKAKGWLVDLFRKDARYNGNGQIVIPANLTRPVNREDIRRFYDWADKEFKKIIAKREIRIGLFSLDEYRRYKNRVYNIWDRLGAGDVFKGKTVEEWRMELDRMNKREKDEIGNEWVETIYIDSKEYSVHRKDYDDVIYFERILRRALDFDSEREEVNIFDEDSVKYINSYAEKMGISSRAIVGQRVNKFVGKLLKEFDMNHIVDVQTIGWTDSNTGEYRTRQKDMGYNYWYAVLGDAINPVTYTREIVISVNPIDYWTMSFGYKWASCHTIDKENSRGVGHSDYQGCYSGGTESYMLDDSSIIVYVRPSAEELESIGESELPMEMQSKFKRVVFMIGEDKLVESRVYPDGRDGGDNSIAGQIRNIMQKVIADLYETPNMWTLKKGNYECENVINTVCDAPHYHDYEQYSDCNVSYLRRINGDLNHNMIYVGSKIICPSCGRNHYEQEHITCDYCYDGIRCARCGGTINRNDDIIEVDDNVYCCYECAENDGYVHTIDNGWQRENYCHYDDYEEEWYYDDCDGVYTYNGYWYHNSETAERAGYRYSDEEDEWYQEDEVYCLENGNTFYKPKHPDAVETPNGWYLSAEDAEEDGWVLDENGNYVAA